MNTINPSKSIYNANSYPQSNSITNALVNKKSMQADSFIKSTSSLVPESYTKELSTNITKTSTLPDIDLDALTQEQIDWYFSYEIDHTGKITYLPIINASDEAKKAWIATINQIDPDGRDLNGYVIDMKDAAALGSGDFKTSGNTNIGLKMSTDNFLNAVKTIINDGLSGKYTYSTGPNVNGIIDGTKECAQNLKKNYDIFEAFYKEYNK